MEQLPYLLQANLYWIALYACYALLLRRHTFLRWNRAYLLGSLLAAFALPLVKYPEAAPAMPIVYEVSAATFTVAAVAPSPSLLTWQNLLWLGYFTGFLIMLLRLARQFRGLFSFVKKGEAIDLGDHTLVLLDDSQAGSFSFLRWIFISRRDYEEHFDTILTHELAHVRQRHSWDILLVEVLRVLFWFNPVLVFYKKSLQQVHEYLADRQSVLRQSVLHQVVADDRDGYAEFLVSYALKAPITFLTNQFFNPKLLKNRIAMLYKNKNSNWSLGKYAVVALLITFTALTVASCERDALPSASDEEMVKGNINVTGVINTPDHKPLRGALVTDLKSKRTTTTDAAGRFSLKVPVGGLLEVSASGFKVIDLRISPKYRNADYDITMFSEGSTPGKMVLAPSADNQSVKVTFQTGKVEGEKVFVVVENQPEFPGGRDAMFKYLSENIKYPEAAKKAKVSGKVFLAFIVTTEGEIRDVKVLKGIGFGADEEAIRMVQNMPRWKSGTQSGRAVNVRYNLPISFELEGTSNNVSQQAPPPPKQVVTFPADDASKFQLPTGPDKPIIILNGKEIANANPRPSFDKKGIKAIKILSAEEAREKYGQKGKNGAIELSLEKK